MVQAIDRLVTLYALGHVNQDAQNKIAALVRGEAKGMNYVLAYLSGQRKDEVAKATGNAKFNANKGYIPSLQQEGVSLIVAEDSQTAQLLEKSYVKLGPYEGSKAEQGRNSKSYFFAPVSTKASFDQGILQNVHQTTGGVDAGSGFSEGMNAGRITNASLVQQITKSLSKEVSKENLRPVFNKYGRVIAYERTIDPTKLVSLNQDTHLAKMIGVWRGRQVEEAVAHGFNTQLVDALHTVYKNDKRDGRNMGSYVDLFDPKSYGND